MQRGQPLQSRRLQTVESHFADSRRCAPSLIFGLIVSTVMGPGSLSAIVAIFFIVLPTMIRVVRGAALGVVNKDFVIAAQISGAATRFFVGCFAS